MGGRRGGLAAVRSLRAAVRTLFAHAVRPDERSPADARNLMPVPRHSTGSMPRPQLSRPSLVLTGRTRAPPSSPTTRPVQRRDALPAALARAVIGFLAGPDRAALRACHAPRCVRYFIKAYSRQESCKPSCGNRARVARHHERHRSSHP
ncbi:CGNR zinc finger domain-containing protein [Streptomyces sp. NPDC051664]|uniref:CGNR zinc finger domain-containing protein n=1 Tax=Streptomyces sp. NPDC051664 TaxID=3365668 RepID=UPI00379835DE